MKNWSMTAKVIFWIVIILILVAIYNYKTIATKLGIKSNTRMYADGGIIDAGHPHPRPFPNFQNIIVTPYYYNQCPDFSTRPAENVMIGGYNNIYFKESDMKINGQPVGSCPSCIIYNGVTYYYNGYDGKGCYYQVNYNYIWPQFYTFNNFGRHGRGGGGHGGPGGPGSGTGPGTGPGTGGGGGHGH